MEYTCCADFSQYYVQIKMVKTMKGLLTNLNIVAKKDYQTLGCAV